MAASPVLSWTQILEQVSASIAQSTELLTAEAASNTQPTELHMAEVLPITGLHGRQQESKTAASDAIYNSKSEQSEALLVDWAGTLDIVSGIGGLADEQNERLLKQSEAYRKDIEELRRELVRLEHHNHITAVREHEAKTQATTRLQELQARASAQVQEIREEAEQRMRAIKLSADARVRIAEERARVAELRADTAEKWLNRISNAAKDQVFRRV